MSRSNYEMIELFNQYEDIEDFVKIIKEKTIDIGENYICIKEGCEYGFTIKIIDKNGECIYVLFFETYYENYEGEILTLFNNKLNIGYQAKIYSNRTENFINGIYHSTNEQPYIELIIKENTKLIIQDKTYPTLSEFILNSYKNDNITFIPEKELMSLDEYILQTIRKYI